MSRVRALGLLSGGLDSALAARLLIDQGLDVIGLHLESPTACRSDVREVAADLGIPLVTLQKGEAYVELLQHPRFGYGRNMNPCVDCRVFMFQRARPVMEAQGARFLFTGEVMGQRPMSQTRERFHLIDREAGLAGWILRPLSAQVLPETEPERLGLVDRSRLLGLGGRSRTAQLELAERLGLKHYQSPGGGCLLTDPIFSVKLRDLFDHPGEERATLEDVALLRVGRHFRVNGGVKIVLGRDAAENETLRSRRGVNRHVVEPLTFSGPTALICGPFDDVTRLEAARLIVQYSRHAMPEDFLRWSEAGRERTRRIAEFEPRMPLETPVPAESK
ncbi:MAG TPA: hypothetical protein VL123_07085 [Candidatus Udaeobacter sp.]|jgi:hypothetical protein|nr:hypothetical protein [Candidatus Udaeobacter sp.]